MGRHAFICGIAVVLAAVLVSVPVAEAKGKKPRVCKKGQITVVLKGRTFKVVKKAPKRGRVVCVKRARPPASKAKAVAAAGRLLRSKPLRPKYLRKLERRPGIRRLRRLLPRLGALVEGRAPVARASRETYTSRDDISDKFGGGVKAETTIKLEAADADEVGGYGEGEGEISVSKGGEAAAMRKGFGDGGFAKRCPDAQGRVAASVKWKKSEGGSSKIGGVDIRGDLSMSFETKIEGRVGDDGRLKDFTYKGTAATEVKGHGPDGRYVVKVYRLAFSGGPIGRDFNFEGPDAARWWQSRDARGWGPRGDNLDAGELKHLRALWTLADGLSIINGKARLLEAEKAWFDRAECVEVRFNPASGRAAPGGTVEGDAAAYSKLDGAHIAGSAITLTTCPNSHGTVSPTSGSSSLHFTLTDSGHDWGRGRFGCVAGESVSRRGRGIGSVSYTVPNPRVPLFDIKVDFTATYNCGGGATVTMDRYTLTGSVNRRDPDNEGGAVGDGTVSGTYQQVNSNGCTGFDTTTVTKERVNLDAAYTDSGPPEFAVSWYPPNAGRWAGFVTRTKEGRVTETWQEQVGDGTVSYKRIVTISNLRSSED